MTGVDTVLLQLHKASPQTPDAHLDIDEAPEQSDPGAPLDYGTEARQIYACLIRVLPAETLQCLARLFVLSGRGSRACTYVAPSPGLVTRNGG
jgi:hypothetical protein